MRLLLASSNRAKIGRLRVILAGLPLAIVVPAEGDAGPTVEEGVVSLRANAEAKARAWRDRHHLATLATDGGLAVPALGDRWNPATTRRAAGMASSDADRAAHLLRLMAGLPAADRRAYRLEAIALATTDGAVRSWQASSSPATVADSYDPRGVPAGFWLPGVLLFGPGQRRYGDLSEAERAAVDDHWGQLAAPVRAAVLQLLGQANG